ncbi:mitochondrial import receptor subunit TOM22 homolog [Mizuhopecten yessoensis]|uniref:Mitochondrial import receptor subunit TOM22 homolog n=1 Tax=Mizuhopecten yessoensis TaxID=6573 RepID=A0A210Q3C0_MIZYE|nr:mitochondrial import receptor subunit TOM22 homolog [Mizuhopecten yessoensis]OWF43169.1 Mitochondrial import receptor subunit TOM22-like [Mizuhopecten yessoensis]
MSITELPPSNDEGPGQLAIEEEDEEDIDETLRERLIGLTEMFPENVRTVCGNAATFAMAASKASYGFTRSALWVVASAATILTLPVVFESERAQHQEMQREQERQILLGPNAAMAGSGANLYPGMMPQMSPPPGAS